MRQPFVAPDLSWGHADVWDENGCYAGWEWAVDLLRDGWWERFHLESEKAAHDLFTSFSLGYIPHVFPFYDGAVKEFHEIMGVVGS